MTDPNFLLTLDLAVARELEDKNPGVFGPHGANAKVIALLEMAFNVGMLLGPLVSGVLLETLGYFWMNCFMCEFCLSIRRSCGTLWMLANVDIAAVAVSIAVFSDVHFR